METTRRSFEARHAGETAMLVAAAAVATAVAWTVASALPPLSVHLRDVAVDLLVPAHYEVAVFPAFAAFAASLAIDVGRGRRLATWMPRAALLVVAAIVAALKLRGVVPLCGPAVFLGAALAYELAAAAVAEGQLVLGAVILGLLVTGWYKLVAWGDAWSFVGSVAVGIGVGVALGKWALGRVSPA